MKSILRFLYSFLLIFAGIAHFTKKEGFIRTVPEILPAQSFIVKFTGVLEVLFGILLWIKKGQSVTSKLLALFMVSVFPANINMAIKEIPFQPGGKPNKLILWLRLPLQIPLIIGAFKLGRK
ncbi:DoxX family protein [Staphylococcus cohnii]